MLSNISNSARAFATPGGPIGKAQSARKTVPTEDAMRDENVSSVNRWADKGKANAGRKSGVTFAPTVEAYPIPATSPSAESRKSVSSRKETPYVPRLALDTSALSDVNNQSFASYEPSIKTEATTRSVMTEFQANASRIDRLLSTEPRARKPLMDVSELSRVYVPRDNIPASVRKFMASRTKKPAEKAVKQNVNISIASSKEPSPLKIEIQREGQRLMARRTELLDIIANFDLDPVAYEQWTVAELEQRVAGLEEEKRRAAAEAILIESGHDPRDFLQFTADEIEDWLEKEIVRKTREIQSARKCIPAYSGVHTTFESPAPVSFSRTSDVNSEVYQEPLHDEDEDEESEAPVVHGDENQVPSPIRASIGEKSFVASAVKEVTAAPQIMRVKMPQVDPMEMTCEEIRAELRKRELKVSGLKSVIAERLAQALAAEVEEEEFLTEGHPFIGRTLMRHFESGDVAGKVIAFLPAVEGDESSARFYVEHEDADFEILDLEDLKSAFGH